MSIPKVIHYVWVGGKPLSPLAMRCIESWQKYAPDFEIKCWDETNSPMGHHYVKAMYEQKKWAFVSDYIRFAVLAREGGVYLDTDQELLKPIDSFLDQIGFVGRSRNGHIESSIIGAESGAEFITEALAFYDADITYTIAETSPIVLARAIETVGGTGVAIYPPEYFHPIAEGEHLTPGMRDKAYGVHHWAESWVPHARWRKLARRLGVWQTLKYFLK